MARVLIIDDDMSITKVLSEYLSHEGYEVEAAHMAEDGFHASVRHPPDLIMLDVNLPDATGFQMVARFREAAGTRTVPIILMSGAARNPNQKRIGKSMGADEYITKPFDVGLVGEKVQQLIQSNKSAAPAPAPAAPEPAPAAPPEPAPEPVPEPPPPAPKPFTFAPAPPVLFHEAPPPVSSSHPAQAAVGDDLAAPPPKPPAAVPPKMEWVEPPFRERQGPPAPMPPAFVEDDPARVPPPPEPESPEKSLGELLEELNRREPPARAIPQPKREPPPAPAPEPEPAAEPEPRRFQPPPPVEIPPAASSAAPTPILSPVPSTVPPLDPVPAAAEEPTRHPAPEFLLHETPPLAFEPIPSTLPETAPASLEPWVGALFIAHLLVAAWTAGVNFGAGRVAVTAATFVAGGWALLLGALIAVAVLFRIPVFPTQALSWLGWAALPIAVRSLLGLAGAYSPGLALVSDWAESARLPDRLFWVRPLDFFETVSALIVFFRFKRQPNVSFAKAAAATATLALVWALTARGYFRPF